ncbi:hypothetical protein SAMN04487864_101226 [Succiniclasticum ruminis]|uniref:Uncharacterized protein n=1 Tax=Succiniclasticum ruminis TaxID=40841 RepID=A0A1G6HT62_9FIRM|nr:hypothetical protein [Succiniclasticum ruminis]SDB97338.1 hypothetical protein SAMN04487864_101226 [Succiniclasticum ruminis]
MNIELSVKEENGVVKIKITSPDQPVVMETATDTKTAGTPVTVATEQNESASPATEAATTDETLKAETTALSAKLAAMNREYERVKKAAYRAGIRLKENLKALGQTAAMSAVGSPGLAPAGVPCTVPRVPEACPQTVLNVPNSVPGETWGQGQAVTSYNSTTNTITYNRVFDKDTDNVIDHTMSDHVMSHKEAETTSTLSPELIGNCLPFVPEETSRKFIPLANLPEMYRNIVTAWNDLPLRSKLKGLYPDVAQKLYHLLKEFGEAAVQKAIRMVADSPFLLGKSSNSSGWVIYFGWLLKPGNLQKILDNKYRNREQEWGQNYYGATCPEYTPWTDTESCYLDPGFMTEGLTTLNEHTRSCLEQAAKLLGLKKENAA